MCTFTFDTADACVLLPNNENDILNPGFLLLMVCFYILYLDEGFDYLSHN